MAELEQTIIIKKINKIDGGHHGGAWKVAYADFVTAMMAFFLLMWLLNAAEEETLEGIADYFSPTIGLIDQEGIGTKGGKSEVMEGIQNTNTGTPSIVIGQPPRGVKPGKPTKKSVVESPEGEQMLFDKAGNSLSEMMHQDPTLADLGQNVMMQQTPEGLKIQVMDTEKQPMFRPGREYLTPAGERLLSAINAVIQDLPNYISISGHTDTRPYNRRVNYSNWELSADRANAARRFLISHGMIQERVSKVLGRADKELFIPSEPENPKNRRIEIILLRGEHIATPLMDRPSAEGANPFANPRPKDNSLLEYERKKQELEGGGNSLLNKEQNANPGSTAVDVVPDTEIKDKESEKNPDDQFVPY
ncbi:MAG: motility protein MotB [Alphaproteobacteria bacterium]|nr:MAG: motility protein MotB [Alphaproteobacteria bacterium]